MEFLGLGHIDSASLAGSLYRVPQRDEECSSQLPRAQVRNFNGHQEIHFHAARSERCRYVRAAEMSDSEKSRRPAESLTGLITPRFSIARRVPSAQGTCLAALEIPWS